MLSNSNFVSRRQYKQQYNVEEEEPHNKISSRHGNTQVIKLISGLVIFTDIFFMVVTKESFGLVVVANSHAATQYWE